MINNQESERMTLYAEKQCKNLNVTYLQEDEDYAKDINIEKQFLNAEDIHSGKFITKALDFSFG